MAGKGSNIERSRTCQKPGGISEKKNRRSQQHRLEGNARKKNQIVGRADKGKPESIRDTKKRPEEEMLKKESSEGLKGP